MQVKVFHVAYEDTPIHVADVNVPDHLDAEDALEFAFRWTNNVDTSWSVEPIPAVTVTAPNPVSKGKTFGRRSTSVGDTMEADGHIYVVASYGFEKAT